MIVLIKNGISGCRRSGLACVAGICASISIHVALAILGLATAIAASAELYNAVRMGGALYLLFIGATSIYNAKSSSLPKARSPVRAASQKRTAYRTAFLEGFWTNLLNPKFTIFLLSMFSQFVSADSGLSEKALLGATILIESAIIWSLFLLAVQFPRFRQILERSQTTVDRLFGVVLIALGLYVAAERH